MTARIVQQHQRQETEAFRLVRVDFAQHAAETNGLGAQFSADQPFACRCQIAFVEDQVDDGLHRCPAFGQGVVRRHLIGDARVVNLALRPHQSLRQGRFGQKEGPRDLAGRKTS